MVQRGRFISFEGGEGTGKSTQIDRLATRLRGLGETVLVVQEPGGTGVGDQLCQVLKYSRASARMVAETELLLFCASRAQLVREVIQPALARGRLVIADRFCDSTTVYQGTGRLLDPLTVATINQFAVGNCMPDLTILIDLDPAIGLERARGRELFDRMENETLEFYQRVRQGFLDLAGREPNRIKVIDGHQSVDAMAGEIWDAVMALLGT